MFFEITFMVGTLTSVLNISGDQGRTHTVMVIMEQKPRKEENKTQKIASQNNKVKRAPKDLCT